MSFDNLCVARLERGIIPIVDFRCAGQSKKLLLLLYSWHTEILSASYCTNKSSSWSLVSSPSYLCLRRHGFAGAKLGGSTREDFQQVVRTCCIFRLLGRLIPYPLPRLNSKVKPRDVAVKDLVTDLSDGVQSMPLICGNTG